MTPLGFVLICVVIVAVVAWSASFYANRPESWVRLLNETRLLAAAFAVAGVAILVGAVLALVGAPAVWIEITGVVGIVGCALAMRLRAAASSRRRG